MAFEGNTGLQVAAQYGARSTGNTVGAQKTYNGINILSLEITSKGLIEGFIPQFVLPKGAKITRAYITVDTALTGVTALTIGEGKAEATNGLALTAAGSDIGVGTRDVSARLTGTWAATAAAATTKAAAVGITSAGTPSTSTGKATVTIEYVYNSRDQAAWVPDKTTFPTYKAQP